MVPPYCLCDVCKAQTTLRLTVVVGTVMVGSHNDEEADKTEFIDLCGPCAIKALDWQVNKYAKPSRAGLTDRTTALVTHLKELHEANERTKPTST